MKPASWILMAAVAGLLTLLFVRPDGAAARADEKKEKDAKPSELPDLEVQCNNGSVLKLKILDEQVTIKTPFGKLVIPASKITEIECATRVGEENAKKAKAAVADLGAEEFKKRDDAMTALRALKFKALPALVEASKSTDLETQKRANTLIEELKKDSTEEEMEVRLKDVVVTDDSRFTGEIEASVLKAQTEEFGEVPLKLMNVRRIRIPGMDKEDDKDGGEVLPDPGSLSGYQTMIGKVYKFRVTGVAAGTVYGTDVHTTDSTLGACAVHSGVLTAGKTGVVKVKILPARMNFVGSLKNGITSIDYNAQWGAFEFVKGKAKPKR